MIGQPSEMAIGPPLFQACPKVVKQPARIEMIENEMAKLEKPDQERLQLLLVAEFGEPLLVRGQLDAVRGCRPSESSFLGLGPDAQGSVAGRAQSSRVTSSSSRGRSGPSNSATARSYFSIPQDQKSKSTSADRRAGSTPTASSRTSTSGRAAGRGRPARREGRPK